MANNDERLEQARRKADDEEFKKLEAVLQLITKSSKSKKAPKKTDRTKSICEQKQQFFDVKHICVT